MQSSKRYMIGMDGGGTKTSAAICDEQGFIVAEAVSDSSNILSRPWEEVEQTLNDLIGNLLKQAGVDKECLEALFFGLAGADRPHVRELIHSSFDNVYPGKVGVENDAISALFSGTWGEPGVVLIAGTGSIAYGVSNQGETFRVGGWGYLLGDEGSGYDLGRKALIAMMREYDGRGEKTLISELLVQHYQIDNAAQIIQLIYGSANQRKQIGEASRLVEQAALQGDPVALRFVDEAVEDLVELVRVCIGKTGEQLPVVLAGGMMETDTLLRQKVVTTLPYGATIPVVPPVVGCLVMALRRARRSVTDAIKENMTNSVSRRRG